jgi:hypothetical protein
VSTTRLRNSRSSDPKGYREKNLAGNAPEQDPVRMDQEPIQKVIDALRAREANDVHIASVKRKASRLVVPGNLPHWQLELAGDTPRACRTAA